jgi:ketosteroid isomerase-like protein
MAEHPDVAIVRRGYEAFSKGDTDTLRELIAADAVHRLPGENQLSGDFKGIDAILGMYGQLFELSGGTISVEPQMFLTDNQGTVVAVHRASAQRGDKSFEENAAIVFTVRGGKAVELHELVEDVEARDAFWS